MSKNEGNQAKWERAVGTRYCRWVGYLTDWYTYIPKVPTYSLSQAFTYLHLLICLLFYVFAYLGTYVCACLVICLLVYLLG